jgi:hypothetical protein
MIALFLALAATALVFARIGYSHGYNASHADFVVRLNKNYDAGFKDGMDAARAIASYGQGEGK